MGLFAFNRARARAAENAAPSLENKTKDELRALAKEKGIKGYYNMKRETLLAKLGE